MELTIFFLSTIKLLFGSMSPNDLLCFSWRNKVLLFNTVLLLVSFPFLSSIKAVYSHQHGNMNEEIDGGLGKDKKRENDKKTTFEN